MKKFLLAIIILVSGLSVSAQDIHFSQFNASPLTLNPALTGKLECTYRFALNYRNQWNSIPAPYVTYSGAFDAALYKGRLGGDALGVGLLFFNDRAGDGNLSNLQLNASLAYHKALGDAHLLSAGFQAAYVQRNVDMTKLVFHNQIGPNGYLNIPSGEPFWGKITYFDLHAGIHWSTVVSDNFSFNFGGAYYHFLEPTEKFLASSTAVNVVESKLVGHGGFSVGLGDNFTLSPSALYMTQSGAQELTAGTTLGYHLETASLYFGSWYRVEDAVVALLGLEFQNLLFGLSYDISVSDVSDANAHRGGFELSIAYNGCIKTNRKVFHCPRF